MRAIILLLGLLTSSAALAQPVLFPPPRGNGQFFPGAAADLNFATQQFLPGNALSQITETRNSIIATEDGLDGTWYTFAAKQFRLTSKGHLHEEARTNSIRNNTMQGGVPGTPGTLPTNWTMGTVAGVTQSIAFGTQSGMPYIAYTVSGTPSASGLIFLNFDSSIVAAQNQVWTHSAFISVQSGGFTNITGTGVCAEDHNNVGAFLESTCASFAAATNAALGLQRFQATNLATSASTAFEIPTVVFNVTLNQAVNITLLLSWPQLELNPSATTAAQGFATSPIPTTSGSVTRAADGATMPLPPGACNAAGCSLWETATFEAPTAFPVNQFVASVNDGTANNQINLYRASTNAQPGGQGIKASSTAQTGPSGTIGPASLAKLSDYVTSSTLLVVYNNGTAGSTASTGVPTVTTLSIGSTVAGATPCNCYVGRIAVAPTSLLGN